MNKNSGAGRFRLPWILIAIAALNGLVWTGVRWHYENAMRQAQLTVDYDDTRVLADAYQVPHAQFLGELKKRGVTSVGMYDLTLNNYRDNGRVAITPREDAEQLYPKVNWANYVPAYRFLISTTKESQALLTGQIYDHLKLQGQPTLRPLQVPLGDGQTGLLLPRSPQLFSDAMLGFDPVQVAAAHKQGMTVTARVSNSLNFNNRRLDVLIHDIHTTGAHVVIFSEDEVVGYDTLIKEVSKKLLDNNLLFGNIEFTKQRGWQDFSEHTNGQLVRVHSVGGEEAAKAKRELLVDRYARAIKERDIRVAYIRLVRQFKGDVDKGESPLQQNLDFVDEINTEIKAQPVPAFLRPGMETGDATGFGNYPDSVLEPLFGPRLSKVVIHLSLFITGLGAVGGMLLLLNLFFDFSPRARRNWLWAGLLVVALLSLSATMGAKLMALEIGCVFSAIGVLWGGLPQLWDASRKRGEVGRPSHETGPMRAFWKGVVILVKTSLITFIGPLLIVALLSSWKFFSGTDKYLLPKLTQLIPLVLVGIAFAGEVFPHRVATEGASAACWRARKRFMNVLNQPFTIRVALTLLVLGVVGMIWIARTGNDSGMEISPFELKFRAILERVFITRPRTKEIFAGMPAMTFAVFFALRRRWLWALAATVVATIGQADLLNTFCHIHTPFFYSLLRSIHGVWLGAVIGGIALAVWVYGERKVTGRFIRASFAPRAADQPPAPEQGGSISEVHIPAPLPAAAAAVAPVATQAVIAPQEKTNKSDDSRSLFYHDENGRLRRR